MKIHNAAMESAVRTGRFNPHACPALRSALAVSLVCHAAVLFLVDGRRDERKPPTVLLVRLVAPQPPQVVAKAPPRTSPPAPAPAPSPVPADGRSGARPVSPEAVSRFPQSAVDESLPRAKGQPVLPPELTHELANRRLRVRLWVDSDGVVSNVELPGNELSGTTASVLTAQLAQMHFAPARKDGRAVESFLQGRLCFDERGEVVDADPECAFIGAHVP